MLRVKTVFRGIYEGARTYDPTQGKYTPPSTEQETRFSHVQDLSELDSIKLFGRVDQRGLRIWHQGTLVQAEYVDIRGKTYKIEASRQLRNKASYLLKEVAT